ncbi:hypothetical protein [Gorillibacterium timonense]|uniref:hypothetical protein n=1 Tax=Gorillibacterium timonense TaxID=1689269 RepID=UPI00071C9956|nr:hypothetical protein [Gorillibacterium timonense]
MNKKHCLFCDEIVPTIPEGDYDRYMSCSCSPGGSYRLLRASYEPVQALPQKMKRDMFHILSAYIRERTDCGDKISLSASDLEPITNDPSIPLTLQEKGNRLLHFLYRHSDGAGKPVVIHPLSSSYNLTYSPNLQELVYLIDMLINEQLLLREGMTFRLTEKGWGEAIASAGDKRKEPCFLLIPDEEDLRTEWSDKLLPKIEQCGYQPHLLSYWKTQSQDKISLELIADSKLIIADITDRAPEVYLMAGYALALKIPVIWTVNNRDADTLHSQVEDIRPLVWNTAEELTDVLVQRLKG